MQSILRSNNPRNISKTHIIKHLSAVTNNVLWYILRMNSECVYFIISMILQIAMFNKYRVPVFIDEIFFLEHISHFLLTYENI